jgi:hypothetical protein
MPDKERGYRETATTSLVMYCEVQSRLRECRSKSPSAHNEYHLFNQYGDDNMVKDTTKAIGRSNAKRVNLSQLESSEFERMNLNAAGIDIGNGFHCVAVPAGRDTETVREFDCFTSDLDALVNWLLKCRIETAAMESTGVYWIPLYEKLEAAGIEVLLVNARQIKNVNGRKTDVLDCQWIQRLHTYGLLQGAFRPDAQICELRGYMRQRGTVIKMASMHIQHMQKALSLMNLQLANVLSDVTGETGMRIIRSILDGERDPGVLAAHRDPRCKSSLEKIKKSLTGHYKKEQIHALKQAVDAYDFCQGQLLSCDFEIERHLLSFATVLEEAPALESKQAKGFAIKPKKKKKKGGNAPVFDVRSALRRVLGVDLTTVPGIEEGTALCLMSEIGMDMSRFRSGKAFAAWLGLSPDNKISGGKILSSKTKRTGSRAARALTMEAFTLHKNKSALGAFYRRLKGRIGPSKAITATAHKLALIIYNMLKHGEEYVEKGQEFYENMYKERAINSLKKRAQALGFAIVESQVNSALGI